MNRKIRRRRDLHQTGKTVKAVDIKIHAFKPGKRKSSSGQTYYERRANRSDKHNWI